MIKDIDLVSYLPPFMRNYKEPVIVLEAENPELELIWKEADKTLYNRFVSTADEYGISRYEKILKIYPMSDDTLELRKIRVITRINERLPYTKKTFEQLLISLLGEGNYKLAIYDYTVVIDVLSSSHDIIREARSMAENIVPLDMIILMGMVLNDYAVINNNTLKISNINRITLSPFNSYPIARYNGQHKYDGTVSYAGYTIIPYQFPVKSNNRIFLFGKHQIQTNNTNNIRINNKHNLTTNTQLLTKVKLENKIISSTVFKNKLKNENVIEDAILTTIAPIKYNGKYKYDGIAYYDGKTAKYNL